MERHLVVLLCVACTDATAPDLRDAPDIRGAVAGAALAALDAEGRFVIPPDVPPGPENVPPITSARARELAAAFTHSYGPAFVGFWSAERGATIQLGALTPSTRVYPAISAFAAVPDLGCHPADVRVFGSFYLMTLDAAGEQRVRMAVSAQLTDFGVEPDGDIDEPPRTGNDFWHEGVRVDRSVGFLMSPEQAVDIAHRRTGALTIEVPRLVMRHSYTPNFGLWRIALDREVTVLHGDRTERVTELFVGPNASERFYIARAQQPVAVPWTCSLIDENLVDSGYATFQVQVTGDLPIVFDPVSPS